MTSYQHMLQNTPSPFLPAILLLYTLFSMCAAPVNAAPAAYAHTPSPGRSSMDSANAIFEEIVRSNSHGNALKGNHECAEAYLKLTEIYYRGGYYTNAFSAAANALKIAETHDLRNLLPTAYNYLGTIYCTWRDFTLGTEYFKKGIETYDSACNPAMLRSLIINIQGAYLNSNNAALALPYYEKMKELPRDSITDYFIIFNKGLFLAADNRHGEAIGFFKEAEKLAHEHKLSPAMLASTYDYIGNCYDELKNDSSTVYWDKAVNTPGAPGYLRLSILKKLSDSFKSRHQRDKAVFYGNQYMILSDSIFEISDINRMKDVQMAYENEKKMRKINELDAEKRESELKLSNQRRFLVAAGCVIAVFIIMSIILFSQKRRLQQAYIDLFERNKEAMALQSAYKARVNEKIQDNYREKNNEEGNGRGNRGSDEESDEVGKGKSNEENSGESNVESNEGKESKPQSVDRLSEEKRSVILSAVNAILGREDLICNPDFSVERLAELSGFNSRYVSHILNETYECNFRTLLNKKRMDIARARIMDVDNYGNFTIQAIAESVGYKSTSSFVPLFRKHTGVTPSMFQKMAKEQHNH